MSSHLAHIGPKELQKASILELFFCFFFGLVLSWMLDRAEQVPKGSQKAILASFGEPFDTLFDIFQTLGMHLDLYRIISQWMFGCFAAQHQSI